MPTYFKICECGITFTTVRTARRYCSKDCAQLFQRRRMQSLRHDREAVQRYSEHEWQSKLRSAGYRCHYCASSLISESEFTGTRDHVVPLSRGGDNSIDNTVPSCWACNEAKGMMTGAEFMAARERREISEICNSPRLLEETTAAVLSTLVEKKSMHLALGLKPSMMRRV